MRIITGLPGAQGVRLNRGVVRDAAYKTIAHWAIAVAFADIPQPTGGWVRR